MQKLVHLEEALHARVVDQVEAVEAVANAIRRSRAGLSDPNRPIGSFLFLGPTGVGKTELARALADYLFDDERAIVRVDMSEYQERHTVSRLVGAPPGYVGYEEGGQLTESVRRRPYSVVLLDEIEKAHTDVFNVLLQLLDDGRLTDGQGRTVDFRNTIVIMTSNLGSAVFADASIDREKQKAAVLEDVRMAFRPEFVNRIDEIVVFDPLGRDEIRQIVDIQLRGLQRRLAERKLTVTLTDAARDYLANKGYDPAFGARPLKRLIQREIQDPLAMKLLSGDIHDGDTIEIDVGDGGLVFSDRLSSGPVSAAELTDTGGMESAFPLILIGFVALVIAIAVFSYLPEEEAPRGVRARRHAARHGVLAAGPVRVAGRAVRALPERGRPRDRERAGRCLSGRRREGVRLLVLRRVDQLEGTHEQDVLPVRLRDRADRRRVLAAHDRQRERPHAAGRCAQLPRHRVRVGGLQPRVQREVAGQEVRERLRGRADDAVAPAERRRARRSRSWATA